MENEATPSENIEVAVAEHSNEVGRLKDQEVKPFISLPYKGKEGEKIISQFRSALTKALPSHVKPQFTYKGKEDGLLFSFEGQSLDRTPIWFGICFQKRQVCWRNQS